MAAEPKDDGDRLEHIRKVADHLGNSNLEEKLNDFLELHAEELRSELRDSGGRKTEYSLRIHQIYMDFLEIVQANLEEFLQREGLTEDELRAGLQGEILDGEADGVNFMNALVSSWEFSSFVGLASEFVDENDENHEEAPAMSPSSSSDRLHVNLGECCKSSRAGNDAIGCGVASSTKNIDNIRGRLPFEKGYGGSRWAEEIRGITGTTRRIEDVHLKEHPVSPGGGGNDCGGDRDLGKIPLHHHGDDPGKHMGGALNDADCCDDEHHHEQEEQGDQDEPSLLAQSKS